MADTNRIEWIDLCKGIGIFLVVLGHTLTNDISLVYIYGFHMPLFFILSGLVYSNKNKDFLTFFKKKFNSLVLPYIFFYLLTYLYWLLLERNFRSFECDWWKPLLGLFYGSQWNGLMDHNGILWFLPCLFMVEMVYHFVDKIENNVFQFFTVLVLAGIGISIRPLLPWCFNISLVALFFYYVGAKLKSVLLVDKENRCIGKNYTMAILFGLAYLLIQFFARNHVAMATNRYGNIPIFVITALLGSVSLICLCMSLNYNRLNWGGVFRKELFSCLCIAPACIKNIKIFRC